jgi:hypothetical protein
VGILYSLGFWLQSISEFSNMDMNSQPTISLQSAPLGNRSVLSGLLRQLLLNSESLLGRLDIGDDRQLRPEDYSKDEGVGARCPSEQSSPKHFIHDPTSSSHIDPSCAPQASIPVFLADSNAMLVSPTTHHCV